MLCTGFTKRKHGNGENIVQHVRVIQVASKILDKSTNDIIGQVIRRRIQRCLKHSSLFIVVVGAVLGSVGGDVRRSYAADSDVIVPQHPVEGGPYYLTFHDEFDVLSIQNPLDGGAASDTSRGWWTPVYHYGGWPLGRDFVYQEHQKHWHQTNSPNNEGQFYVWNEYKLDTGETVSQTGGSPFVINNLNLVIRTRPMSSYEKTHMSRPDPDQLQYISGLLNSFGTFYQLGGYWEIRMKLPQENTVTGDRAGLWPAFWLVDGDKWGYTREIDILEFVARNPTKPSLGWGFDVVHANFHNYEQPSLSAGTSKAFPGGRRADDGFHTYSLEWLINQNGPDMLIWRTDGVEVFRTMRDLAGPMHMHLNVAVGGDWPGYPHGLNNWPADVEIDYVRVFSSVRPPTVKGPGGTAGSGPAPGPKADAGPDQTVEVGDLVTLDGSGSRDPRGEPLTHVWRQVAGTGVDLDLATSVRPTFIAPRVPLGGETLTFELVVTDRAGVGAADAVNITVAAVNAPPIADAGDDQDGVGGNPPPVSAGGIGTLDGSRSYDPDNDPLTCDWAQTGGAAVTLDDPAACVTTFVAPASVPPDGERLTFELVVDDGFDSSGSDGVAVLVTPLNRRPIANAGGAVDGSGAPVPLIWDEGALVMLDGSRSSDPDGDRLNFAWRQTAGASVALVGADLDVARFVAPAVPLGSGPLAFELTVDDGELASTDRVLIQVRQGHSLLGCDAAAPSTRLLWPPSHKLELVEIRGIASSTDATVFVTITGVTQDEPVDGLGNGDTGPDAVIQPGSPADRVLLRAERDDRGDGRVYSVSFAADDSLSRCSGRVEVIVPIKRGKAQAVDSGRQFDSTL